MYIDWVTWSVWLIGFAILVIWIYFPIREFKKLWRKRKEQKEK